MPIFIELSRFYSTFLCAKFKLLNEKNTLFDDITKKLDDFSKLKQMLKDILYLGKEYSYNADDHLIQLASMFGYITEKEGRVHISNRKVLVSTCFLQLANSLHFLTNLLCIAYPVHIYNASLMSVILPKN